MAQPSTLFRFRFELSDVERGKYQPLDVRTAMHPSETPIFLLTRMLAYALNFDDDLEFPPGGLSDPDAPALRAPGKHGGLRLWIEVGNPSFRKLHRAAKAADQVKIYTYKDPRPLLAEMRDNKIHKVESIHIFSFKQEFLDRLAALLARDNQWAVLFNEGALTITAGNKTEQGELIRHEL
ncbi:MAG: YaeQ family protein [Bdellovibrionia bacterium]